MSDHGSGLELVALVFVVTVPLLVAVAHWRLRLFEGLRPSGVLIGLFLLMYFVDAVPFVYANIGSDVELGERYLWVVLLMFAGMLAGMAGADRFVRPRDAKDLVFRTEPGQPSLGNPLLFWGLLAVFGAVALIHVAASGGYETVTEFAGSEGRAAELAELRTDVNQPRATSYAAGLARFAILPPLALAAVALAFDRRRPSLVLAAIGAWVIVMVSRMAILHKAPVVLWVLAPLLVWATRRSARKAFFYAGLAIVLFALLVTFLYGFVYGTGWAGAWEHTVRRVTWVQQITVMKYLETFPDLHEHLWGSSVSFIQTLSGQAEVVPAYALVMRIWHFGGTPTCAFVGDAWADFGWAGVAVESVAVGMLVRTLESLTAGLPKTALSQGLYVSLLLAVVNLGSVALGTALLTHGILLGPIVVFVLWSLRSRHGSVARGAT